MLNDYNLVLIHTIKCMPTDEGWSLDEITDEIKEVMATQLAVDVNIINDPLIAQTLIGLADETKILTMRDLAIDASPLRQKLYSDEPYDYWKAIIYAAYIAIKTAPVRSFDGYKEYAEKES
jgi:hypothetical protein